MYNTTLPWQIFYIKDGLLRQKIRFFFHYYPYSWGGHVTRCPPLKSATVGGYEFGNDFSRVGKPK